MFVIIFCLNVLLLDAYIYSQRRHTIELSITGFVEKVKSLLTSHFSAMIMCLVIYIICGIYTSGMFSSFVFDLICHFDLDRVPGSLVVCTAVIFLRCTSALMVFYTLLPDGMLTWQDVGRFITFPFLCGEGLFLALTYNYKGGSLSYHRLRCPLWLLNLTWAIVTITVIATIPVQGMTTPLHLSASSPPDGKVSPQPTTTVTVTVTMTPPSVSSEPLEPTILRPVPTVLPTPPSSPGDSHHSAQHGAQCVGLDGDIKPTQLHYLQYRDHRGEMQELRINQRLYGHCRDLAGIFGYESLTTDCAVDVKSCCRSVFSAWRDQGSPGYSFSWRGLIKAITELGLKRLAAEIKHALDCLR